MVHVHGDSLVMTATAKSHEATLECLLTQLKERFGREASCYDVLTMPNHKGKGLIHLLVEKCDIEKNRLLRRAGSIVEKDFDDILAYAHEIYRTDLSKIELREGLVAGWWNTQNTCRNKCR